MPMRMIGSAWLLFLIPPVLWTGNIVMARGLNELLPPVGLAFWRWLLAFLILTPFVARLAWRQRALLRQAWPVLLAAGCFGIAGYNVLVYVGLQSTPAVNAAVLNSIIPVVIPLFAWAIARDPLVPRQVLGIAVSLLGVLWIVCRGEPGRLAALEFTGGDLWILVSVVNWALYSVLLRYKPAALNPVVFLYGSIGLALVALLPFLVVEVVVWNRPMPVAPVSLAAILYVALFASIAAFLAWNQSVAALGPTLTGLSIHLMPVFIGVSAFVLLGEPIEVFHLIGFTAVLTGILVAFGTRLWQRG